MKLHRRMLLRGMFQGAGAMVALPLLDCFLDGNGTALADGTPIPTRFGTFFWGCGLTKQLFLPKETAARTQGETEAAYLKRLAAYEDTPQLAALKPYRAKFNLLSGYRAYVDSKPNIQHWSGNAAISTGVLPTASNPTSASRFTTSGCFTASAIAAETFATTAAAVPAGATMPCHTW